MNRTYSYYKELFKEERLPLAYVDLDLFDQNIQDLLKRAGNKQIRIASKSMRCPTLMRRVLEASPQFQGIMCYTIEEALWLSEEGFDDLLVAYPSFRPEPIRRAAEAVKAGKKIYLMTDSAEHLNQIQAIAAQVDIAMPVFIDIDLSSRWPFLHFGVHRSGIWNSRSLKPYLKALQKCPHLNLIGLMGYEAQIAGLGNQAKGKTLMNTAIDLLQKRSMLELAKRRKELLAQIEKVFPKLQIVNGGGTGSLESTGQEEWVTELTVGSGFYAPALFDQYSHFRHQPAAGFAIEIVRQPQPNIYTCLGGGYVASGGIGPEKAPLPYLPEGAALTSNEMAGEVQTPIQYTGKEKLSLGDPILLRHSKAGELCEHFQNLSLIKNGQIVDRVKTYRGFGQCFL